LVAGGLVAVGGWGVGVAATPVAVAPALVEVGAEVADAPGTSVSRTGSGPPLSVGEAPEVALAALVAPLPGVGVRVGVGETTPAGADVEGAVGGEVGKNKATGKGVAVPSPPSPKRIGESPRSAIGVPLAAKVWITAA
jgi:hypothetical protein